MVRGLLRAAEVVEEVVDELVGARVSFAVGGEVPGEGQVRRAVGEGTLHRAPALRACSAWSARTSSTRKARCWDGDLDLTPEYVAAAERAGHHLPDGMPAWPSWSAPR